MKIALILPYFGKLPDYFNLYLKSCEYNIGFTWIIITDDRTKYDYPNNVKVIYTTFDKIQDKIKMKFDFPVKISYPHKLCDYKPAYGYIFEDLIFGYDFWGHCDPDCIWGNLSKFITFDMLTMYDKIFSLGHLTLYRNKREINQLFKNELNGKQRYKEVFTTETGCLFDEQNKQSINDIFESTNYSYYKQNYCADIDPYCQNFRLSIYDINSKTYILESVEKQIFYWKEGELFRLYESKNKIIQEEFIYIHLQKRKMNNMVKNISKGFIIIPGKFLPLLDETDYDLLFKKYYMNNFNFQFFRVKMNSLRFRIKRFLHS